MSVLWVVAVSVGGVICLAGLAWGCRWLRKVSCQGALLWFSGHFSVLFFSAFLALAWAVSSPKCLQTDSAVLVSLAQPECPRARAHLRVCACVRVDTCVFSGMGRC